MEWDGEDRLAAIAIAIAKAKAKAKIEARAKERFEREQAEFDAKMAERGVKVRIPRQTGHRFHANLDSDSTAIWTLIPGQSGQSFVIA